MTRQADDSHGKSAQTIVRTAPRWLGAAAIFAMGVGIGALAFDGDTSTQEVSLEDAIGIGCGVVTLVVDAEDLPGGAYGLRASVGRRMLPMINSMTYPLIGAHRDHQLLTPDDGRILVVANVPAGAGEAGRWELVGGDAEPAAGGVLPDTCP